MQVYWDLTRMYFHLYLCLSKAYDRMLSYVTYKNMHANVCDSNLFEKYILSCTSANQLATWAVNKTKSVRCNTYHLYLRLLFFQTLLGFQKVCDSNLLKSRVHE